MRRTVYLAGAALLLTVVAARTEPRDDMTVKADRTEVRMTADSSLVKEYRGNVRIWNRSVDAESHRAVFESRAGVFRLYGAGTRGQMSVLLKDARGREKAKIFARSGALFVRAGVADSAFASGKVRIFWKPRNARVTADSVRWSASRKRIWADGAVTLTVDGIVERGTEFEANDDLTWYTMRKVSGTVRIPKRK